MAMVTHSIDEAESRDVNSAVWGGFRVSGKIQECSGSRAFLGNLTWKALPQAPGLEVRDVVLLLIEDECDAVPGDKVPGGRLSLHCSLVEGLAANDMNAKATLMDTIQKKWPRLESYNLPPA